MCGAFTISGVVGSTVQVSYQTSTAIHDLCVEMPPLLLVILCVPTSEALWAFNRCRDMLDPVPRTSRGFIVHFRDYLRGRNGGPIRG
jgi:hypothetical protein